ncbi:hypothetical protein IIA28_11730 [candidate division KSB1 bacterium]|nr:hypothetical protein [candidate division KSB1 bacterium]
MTTFVHYDRGKLSFEYDSSSHKIENLLHENQDLGQKIRDCLRLTNLNIKHPFGTSKWRVFFNSCLENISNDVFDAVKQVKTQDQDNVLAAFLATQFFQHCATFWIESILDRGMHMIGIAFWQSVLKITKKWEDSNTPITVHKGTPYFFLAENYLLVGDRETGFVYLSNAREEDKKLPELNYPDDAPANYTARMLFRPNNHLFYLVRELNNKLGNYLIKYKKNYNQNFKMQIDLETIECKKSGRFTQTFQKFSV